MVKVAEVRLTSGGAIVGAGLPSLRERSRGSFQIPYKLNLCQVIQKMSWQRVEVVGEVMQFHALSEAVSKYD